LRGYNGLVDLGCKKHYRVHHGKNEFTKGKKHINGPEDSDKKVTTFNWLKHFALSRR
jgi:hypothetical protein